ncbi:MAG: hypothetical protein IJI60_04830 [Bacilli bacterium]|nr:hypothetical protein [Bacilli bacterium]
MTSKEEKKEKILKFIEEQKSHEARIQGMVSNTDYVDWLDQFTLQNPIFSENDWIFSDTLSIEDKKNVQDLFLFFRAIDSYAKRNYIAPSVVDNRIGYTLHKDDFFFQIGYHLEEDNLFFCERLAPVKGSIDFYQVMNKNLSMRTMYIDQALSEISSEIRELVDVMEVPIEFIEDMVCNVKREFDEEKKYMKK